MIKMKIELNNNKMNELKLLLDLSYIESNNNKKVINDLFDDHDEFEINDEIFIDLENDDEFINNIIVLCIISYFKESLCLNDDLDDDINYYLYKRFIIYHDYNFYIHQIQLKGKYYDDFNKKFVYNSYNYNIMNFIYSLLDIYNIYINDSYLSYENIYDNYIDIKNKFILNEYSLDDILKHDHDDSYIENYYELIDCITIYHDKYDLIDEINDLYLYNIDDNIKRYFDYDEFIDDLIDDYTYFEFDDIYIHQGYF